MAKGAYIGVKRALPSGYSELDYIESNGKQYINTDFKPNNNTRVVMEVYNDAATTEFLFGARNASSRPEYTFGFVVMSETVVRYDYASVETSLTVDTAVGKMVVDANKSVCLCNSAEITPTAATFAINYPLYLLAMNTAGSTVSAPASAKLYSCKIYDNGKTVRDYVPCINASGVAGLYDFVNGKFYSSAGSGAFVAGNAAVSPDKYVARKVKKGYIGIANFTKRNLPSGYTQTEHIESSGTQYVDTGFVPNNNSRIVIDVQLTSTATQHIFGARATSTSGLFFAAATSATVIRVDYGSEQKSNTVASVLDRVTIDLNKNTCLVGSASSAYTAATFTPNATMLLFGSNTAGTIVSDTYKARMKLYSCQIYDNGTLIRDYVPCTNASGAAGLYDLVNGTFSADAAGGSFVAGGAVKSLARKIKKAYIGIGGVARPCWSGGELAYYGNLGTMSQGLSAARQYFTATPVGDYAVFAGGYDHTYGACAVVDAFSSSLVRTVPSAMTYQQDHNASATVNDIAMFAGISGNPRSPARIYATSYNASLTKTDLTSLPDTVYALAAASIGDYVLFGGGTPGSYQTNRVTTYNSALTQGSAPVLDISSAYLAATTIGGYAVFAGGANGWPNSAVATANAYDASLTKVAIENLSVGRFELTACSTNEYAIFAGGQGGENNPYQKTVEVYDASLTRRTVNGLSIARSRLASTGVGDFAVIAGGQDGNAWYETVDAYDSSLTRTTATSLTSKREGLAATTIGNYALFAGGSSDSYTAVTSAVWVYTVV